MDEAFDFVGALQWLLEDPGLLSLDELATLIHMLSAATQVPEDVDGALGVAAPVLALMDAMGGQLNLKPSVIDQLTRTYIKPHRYQDRSSHKSAFVALTREPHSRM